MFLALRQVRVKYALPLENIKFENLAELSLWKLKTVLCLKAKFSTFPKLLSALICLLDGL